MKYVYYNSPLRVNSKSGWPSGSLIIKLRRFFKVLYLSFTYNNTHRNIVYLIVSLIGLVSTLFRYGYVELLQPNDHTHTLYYLIWICVLASSANCCRLYVFIFTDIIKTREQYRIALESTLRKSSQFFPALLFVTCICISILATTSLYSDMVKWGEEIVVYKLPNFWFYSILLLVRLVQRLLSCLLIITIAPVLHYWFKYSSHEFKDLMVQLLPWHTFHLFQRLLTFATLSYMRPSGLGNWAYFFLIQGFLLWIPIVSFTAANEYIFPILHAPDEKKKTQKIKSSEPSGSENAVRMVTGLTRNKPFEYPPNTELVRGGALERFRNFLKPTVSQPTTSPGARRDAANRTHRQTRTNIEYSFKNTNDSDILSPDQFKHKDDSGKEEERGLEPSKDMEATLTGETKTVETQGDKPSNELLDKKEEQKWDSLFEERTLISDGLVEFLPTPTIEPSTTGVTNNSEDLPTNNSNDQPTNNSNDQLTNNSNDIPNSSDSPPSDDIIYRTDNSTITTTEGHSNSS